MQYVILDTGNEIEELVGEDVPAFFYYLRDDYKDWDYDDWTDDIQQAYLYPNKRKAEQIISLFDLDTIIVLSYGEALIREVMNS